MKYTNDANKAKTLLDEINLQQLRDSDDELKAILLRFLYPNYLSINQLFDYLHLPKTKHLFGTYLWFWEHDFAEHCPDDHLIIALSIFINNQEKVDLIAQSYHFRQMVSRITARSISVHGDKVTDEVLYSWLDFVSNKNDQLTMDSEDINEVEKWLSERPDRYKQLLKYYIEVNKTAKTITMYDFKNAVKFPRVPDDYGAWCLNQIIDETNQDIVKIYLSEAVSTLILQRGNDNMSLELLEQWALGNIVRQKILNTYLVWEVDTRYRKNSKIRYDREKDWEEKKRVRTTEFNKQFSKIKSGIASVQIMYQLAYVWKGLFVDISGETIQERFDNYVENGSQLLNVAKQGFIASPERSDIPTVKDIISLSIQRKEYYISHPCLIGMELRWEQGMKSINTLVNDSLQCMVAFNLTLLNDKTPEWLTFLAKTKPELVAEVYSKYAVAHVKLKSSSISLLHQLENNAEYSELAVRVVPHILDKFPIRVNRDQLYNLKYLLRSAINNTKSVIPKIIDKKLLKKSLTASQKVYYLAAGVIADPDKFESQLWQFVGNSKSKLNHLAEFLDSRHADSSIDSKLTPYSIGQLIENLMPYADISMTTGDGKVTGAMRYGNQIKSLIRKLSNMNTIGTEKELDRLVKNPLLKNLKYTLEDARYQVRQKRRETSFSYLSVTDVASVITNNKPTNAADLNALVLHHLDDINNDIHNDNDDGFAKYWNIDRHRKPESKRVENACRDELLTRLRNKLNPLGIDCEPEGDYSNDKRADIRISYKNMIEIPVEAKRDDNDELWEACTSQLVKQYTIAPKAKGFGIYIVFWFGKGDIRKPIDGSDKPKSAEELEYKLEKILGNENYERITVKVIDVSWP
ncbi:MAG: hypothetical protein DBP00_16240 [gamma proteobacterium symbiont of Ctena orbiculata]|nr:MAG: hypothetical protein DBP00_16240 [gamma proteobacterium symbiont of Ctena orbiculata]